MALLHRILRHEDWETALNVLGSPTRKPDLTIRSDDGSPYLHRWHVIPHHAGAANVYFHVQVASDPERPLHDHPWDNQSVILAGGYQEVLQEGPHLVPTLEQRVVGQTVWRKAEVSHRLVLPATVPYTMTLFSTGPVRRDWGFWINGTWYSHNACLDHSVEGKSVFHYPKGV